MWPMLASSATVVIFISRTISAGGYVRGAGLVARAAVIEELGEPSKVNSLRRP